MSRLAFAWWKCYCTDQMKFPLWVFFKDSRDVFKIDRLNREIAEIAIPAALALLADPIASLIDTAYIGHIGPVELAAVGVAIAVFNQVSRITIFPLVSVTTSFVAEEDTLARLNAHSSEYQKLDSSCLSDTEMEGFISDADPETDSSSVEIRRREVGSATEKRRKISSSASSAMVIAALLGVMQAMFLISSARLILKFMGVDSESPMLKPARQYLTLRSLGAPAVLLSLAMQAVFRGLKDTKTPLYATVVGDVTNIILDPILIFKFRMGVSGAAIAHVISQYIISMILMWKLKQEVNFFTPHVKDLQFQRFLKNGLLLLLRVIAVTFCVTLGASLAARLGSTPMAAFQVCLQIWLASSLLADGLAVAGQAILAAAFARKDYEEASNVACRVLQLGLVLGIFLSLVLVIVLQFTPKLFTEDVNVLQFISLGIPFVAVTQPINALAFVFDGINYGASDFAYSAYSMVVVAIVSICFLLVFSYSNGFVGIWVALSIYMSLRVLAGLWRMGSGTGPWSFLKG